MQVGLACKLILVAASILIGYEAYNYRPTENKPASPIEQLEEKEEDEDDMDIDWFLDCDEEEE